VRGTRIRSSRAMSCWHVGPSCVAPEVDVSCRDARLHPEASATTAAATTTTRTVTG